MIGRTGATRTLMSRKRPATGSPIVSKSELDVEDEEEHRDAEDRVGRGDDGQTNRERQRGPHGATPRQLDAAGQRSPKPETFGHQCRNREPRPNEAIAT